MNTLEFAIWRPDLFEEGLDRLNYDHQIDRIIFYAHSEFEYYSYGFQHFETIVDYSDKHDIPVYITICTSRFVKPLHDTSDTRYRNVVIQHWGTFLLTDAIMNLSFQPVPEPEPFKFPFISMNNKPHAHRSLMIDTLAKYNLIDRGAVSWRQCGESISDTGYSYKYWTPVKKMLTESDTLIFRHLVVPREYNQSFVQLVVESSERHLVASEKTWVPLISKKLFIVLGGQHHHAMLQIGRAHV